MAVLVRVAVEVGPTVVAVRVGVAVLPPGVPVGVARLTRVKLRVRLTSARNRRGPDARI